MTTTANHLLQQALSLPQSDREELADQLYLSLHTTDEVKQAWSEELARRIAQVDSGQVTLLSTDDVHQQIQQLIDREQSAS